MNTAAWHHRGRRRARRHRLIGYLAVAAITLAALTSSAGADWQEWLTRPLNVDPSQSAWYPQLTAIDGVLHVTWSENIGQIEWVHVAKLGPTGVWQLVGGPLNTPPQTHAGFYPNIAAVGSVPYATWGECNDTLCNARSAYVARFDETSRSWQLVGGNLGGNTNSANAEFSDVTAVAGVPWVAWEGYGVTAGQVFAAHMNGGQRVGA